MRIGKAKSNGSSLFLNTLITPSKRDPIALIAASSNANAKSGVSKNSGPLLGANGARRKNRPRNTKKKRLSHNDQWPNFDFGKIGIVIDERFIYPIYAIQLSKYAGISSLRVFLTVSVLKIDTR
jgi:hypothetical protein